MGSGTGLVALGDYYSLFSYLPFSFGIEAVAKHAESVASITAAGTASGVYNGLTAGDMSYWGNSYHVNFNEFDDSFEVFEYAGDGGVVSIGRDTTAVPEPGTVALLGVGLLGIAIRAKRKSEHRN